jgi:flagellar biosynthetic protein FliQ
VPKLVIVVMTMALLSSFTLTQMTDYFAFIFDEIVNLR